MQTSGQRFRQSEATFQFFENVLYAASRVPGVTSAAFTSQLPMSGDLDSYGVHMERNPTQRPEPGRSAFRYAVTPAYFETTGIPLLRGRLLEESDRAGAPRPLPWSASLGEKPFPQGQGFDRTASAHRSERTVDCRLHRSWAWSGDVKQMSLMRPEAEAIYVTLTQWRFADNVLTLVVRRAEGDVGVAGARPSPRDLVGGQRSADRPRRNHGRTPGSVGCRAPLCDDCGDGVCRSWHLVLAAAGIYGVLSGGIAERFREIGVRAALGASPSATFSPLVVRQGIKH